MAGFKSYLNANVSANVANLGVGAPSNTGGSGNIQMPLLGVINFDPVNDVCGLYGPSAAGNAGCMTIISQNQTLGNNLFCVMDHGESVNVFAAVSQGSNLGGIKTTPLASQAPTGGNLALGTAWHNTNAWDVTLLVSIAVTANTSLVVSLGVGPTNTPAQQTLITGTVATGLFVVPIKVPAGYWALLSTSGTATDTIVGQMQLNS